jgi:hypothetical protein
VYIVKSDDGLMVLNYVVSYGLRVVSCSFLSPLFSQSLPLLAPFKQPHHHCGCAGPLMLLITHSVWLRLVKIPLHVFMTCEILWPSPSASHNLALPPCANKSGQPHLEATC